MNLKQLFCEHVWQETKEEYLRKVKEYWGYDLLIFKYYAIYETCVKCGKTRIVEKRKMLEK